MREMPLSHFALAGNERRLAGWAYASTSFALGDFMHVE
jgi:hypothetical protein